MHYAGFIHESMVEVFNLAILCGCIWGSELVGDASFRMPFYYHVQAKLAVVSDKIASKASSLLTGFWQP